MIIIKRSKNNEKRGREWRIFIIMIIIIKPTGLAI